MNYQVCNSRKHQEAPLRRVINDHVARVWAQFARINAIFVDMFPIDSPRVKVAHNAFRPSGKGGTGLQANVKRQPMSLDGRTKAYEEWKHLSIRRGTEIEVARL